MTNPIPDTSQFSLLLVEQFFSSDSNDGPYYGDDMSFKRYIVSFIGWSTNDLCRSIADAISDCGAIRMPMDEVQGYIFLNSIIHDAVHDEAAIGFMPLMPWDPRPDEFPWLLMHSPPEGGVEVGFGDDDPWDATMWELRYSEKWAS